MAIIDNFSEEELRQIVLNSTSMKQVIDKLGYATHSGSNNSTVKARLENLRWVCPNCNQQLDTTCGKNKANRKHITLKGVIEPSKLKFFCKECNKEITSQSKSGLCQECYNKSKRVCERPSREELKNLIRTIPFTRIGEKFGVSDKAITKWCVSENLPSRKKDINSYSDEEWEFI